MLKEGRGDLLNFNLWIESLKKPTSTFKREKKNANLGEGALHMVVAGIITGFLSGLYYMFFGTTFFIFSTASGKGVLVFLISLIISPILSVISWLIISGILYIFALIFGGKGDYKTQSYLYAIYLAPLSIITTVVSFIPLLGGVLALLIFIYNLYLLTLALRETHKYTTGMAVLTWLVPILIIIIILSFLLLVIGFLAISSRVYPLPSI